MKFIDEYRNVPLALDLLARIRRRASRPWVLMEVCGGQTHSLLRHGIDAQLDGAVELIHGPGCPVCVTPEVAVDAAQNLALHPGVVLATFGDMLRVPGGRRTLHEVRAAGGQVKIVYSPLDAVELARRTPDRQIVFFSVGFETTAPATALAVLHADRLGVDNFSLLVAHVCVQPAMEAILQAGVCRVQGFLAAGHVCTVLGYDSYVAFVNRHRVPVVVTGFEPVDLLAGILECVEQLESQSFRVANCYPRSVRPEGNRRARQIVEQVFEPADGPWRGLGTISRGVLRLRDEWGRFDAARRFGTLAAQTVDCATECRAGDVLAGQIKPPECPAFGTRCTPDAPLGAPMVSSEGACAAYFQYRRVPVDATIASSPLEILPS